MDKTLEPGSLLAERYCIKGVLATGGMGAVYDALDERLGRDVAVKVVLRELAQDRQLVARFEREASVVARLSHPSVVHVHDFGTTREGISFLVMERLSGSTLSELLDRHGALSPERASDLIEQALGGLEVAHAAGIVHRDLKPANLMVVPAGPEREVVKILDFGVAQLMEGEAYARLTRTGALIGTPSFMSPEQARGQGTDARTDLYAMGVVLYCALTGRRPFEGDLRDVLERVKNELPQRADLRRPGVPPELARIAERAMQKDPAHRYASAREMAAALVGWRRARGAQPPAPAAIAETLAMQPPSEATTPASGPPTASATAAPRPAAVPPVAVVPAAASGSTPPSSRGWLGRLSWIALGGLVGSCALTLIAVGVAAALLPPDWADEIELELPSFGMGTPTPPPAEPPPMVPLPQPPAELGGPSGACNRAYACCVSFQRNISSRAACETVHSYDGRPRQLCDEVRDRYREALAAQGYDTEACGE